MDRPDWDTYFLGIAEAASARGECVRRKVGAVLVDRESRVRGVGYNGALPKMPSCLEGACPRGKKSYEEQPAGADYSDCISNHAEYNALLNARPDDIPGSSIYVSSEPCARCVTLMRSVGIYSVHWGKEVLWP